MPRRLDPKKGLPGLFAPGRPKTADMELFVDARGSAPRSPSVQAKDAAVAQESRAPERRELATERGRARPPTGSGATALETPPRPRARPRKLAAVTPAPAPPAPAPCLLPEPTPLPDYLLLAPPFRAVPALRTEPEPVRLAEVPSFIRCGMSWIVSLCRS